MRQPLKAADLDFALAWGFRYENRSPDRAIRAETDGSALKAG